MPFTFDQLRRGLERAEFVPYFQPVVDLRSGGLHGFEVLARWERPHSGLIGPDVFVPCLERHGLINNLTATLLIQAFAAVRACRATSVWLSTSRPRSCTTRSCRHWSS